MSVKHDFSKENLSDLPTVLTTRESAEILRVSENTVKNLFSSGDLAAFKIGAVWRVERIELLKFMRREAGSDFVDDIRLASQFLDGIDTDLAIRLSAYADELEQKTK